MRKNISIQHAVKRYGNSTVIHDLSLFVREGEFFTLLGPSGCGKTTLLRMIAGFNSIEGGDFFFNDTRINDMDPAKRNIGMVFQNYAIFPNLTVRKNIEFGLKIRKVPKDVMKRNADEAIELVGLSKFADYYPNQLSASMLQRVAIGRAFAVKPDLLLMDEPYGQLDIDLRFQLEDELLKLWQHTHTTVIFITHNIEEAVYMAERVLILTNKPAKVKESVQIDLPRPRDVSSPDFIRYRKYITDQIRWW